MGYWDTVESIAQEAVDEYPEDSDNRMEYVTESVDGSEYIIYYSKNEEVLLQSKNEPEDSAGMAGNEGGWRKMRMVAAFMAMETDVHEAVDRLIDEREEAEVLS